jgi:hypothetical protein
LPVQNSLNALKPENGEPISGDFSAIVRMHTSQGRAEIQATTTGYFDYVGSFTELQVSGDCERSLSSTKVTATLTINRINGAFEHGLSIGKSYTIFSGHCTPGKKLF